MEEKKADLNQARTGLEDAHSLAAAATAAAAAEEKAQLKAKSRKIILLATIALLVLFIIWASWRIYHFMFDVELLVHPGPVSSLPTTTTQEKKGRGWLEESTSASSDPRAGAIFSSLFLEGETDRPVASISDPRWDQVPNLIYGLIETISLKDVRQIPVEEIMTRAMNSDWYLQVSWNSPKPVYTADEKQIKPNFITFWVEGNNLFLHLDNPNDPDQQSEYLVSAPDNNEFGGKIIQIVNENLPEAQALKTYQTEKISFQYPPGYKIEKTYDFTGEKVIGYNVALDADERPAGHEVRIRFVTKAEAFDSHGVENEDKIEEELARAFSANQAGVPVTFKKTTINNYQVTIGGGENVPMTYIFSLESDLYLVIVGMSTSGRKQVEDMIVNSLEFKKLGPAQTG